MGPKHSGKTSTGRELAKLLKYIFFDLDVLIEERTGQSPRDLYNAGPELFRREEEAALASLFNKKSDCPGIILALGGGIIDNSGAMDLIKKEMTVFEKYCTLYLELSAETAWQRITDQVELPLFLTAETPAESKEKHRQLHERRAKGYKKIAMYSIQSEGKTAVELASEIAAKL
ncbi:MAG: shikimate kinase [Treponema sp.]|jgi:shikimate kinase|nr:shikimate kinase [Treponema sp.]